MQIINSQNYITNKQFIEILKLLGTNYIPKKLIICENRKDVFNLYKWINPSNYIAIILDFTIWRGKVEGINDSEEDLIIIYVFSQDYEEYDRQDKQLYSIHALFHETRHRWQECTSYSGDAEIDADNFATTFINKKSKKISKIMHWDDEWEVEEEE
jgi:hypothetical protein